MISVFNEFYKYTLLHVSVFCYAPCIGRLMADTGTLGRDTERDMWLHVYHINTTKSCAFFWLVIPVWESFSLAPWGGQYEMTGNVGNNQLSNHRLTMYIVSSTITFVSSVQLHIWGSFCCKYPITSLCYNELCLYVICYGKPHITSFLLCYEFYAKVSQLCYNESYTWRSCICRHSVNALRYFYTGLHI